MKNILIGLLLIITSTLNAQDVTGDWNGALDIQGMQLRIVFHITQEGEGFTTTMDSPDQGANGIPTDKTTFENGNLTIEASKLGLKYVAKLNDEGSKIEGTFNQNGMSFPLNLSKEKIEKKEIVRSQNPINFPYQQEEVKFINLKGGHELAGTLTMPSDGKFEKAVVLVSGSGPQDRNEELLGHKPFLVLSDHLTRKGIAVLRYDDRGVGESSGEFSTATTKDFADDASAAISFLKKRKDMEGKQLGVVGHSEGGMIAPIVATENSDVDMIVLLAGPGINIKELMMIQSDKIAESEGVPEEVRKVNSKVMNIVFGYIQSNANLEKEKLKEGLGEILNKEYDGFSEEIKKEIGAKEDFMSSEMKMMLTDWFVYFMSFDPADYLTKVTCPVLAVNGELDLQVTSKENLEGIKQSLKVANNKNATIHEFKGLNHLFQKTETGAPSEYSKLEETFNQEAMEYISNWLINYDKK